MPVQKPRQREKKIVNQPMEVKQYGPSQFTKNDVRKTVAQKMQKNTANPSMQIAQKMEKKKDPNRFKAISDRANANRTDEQKAAIQKNNDRIYWQNKERMNNSGSYKAMMQSRTKNAMQKASDKNLYGGDNISNIKGEKKNSAYKQYEKAFGRKKGR